PKAEFAAPISQPGYVGSQTPQIVGAGAIGFSGSGGTGPYSFAPVSMPSGGTITAAGAYSTTGTTLDVLDGIRIVDSAGRSFDTRIAVATAAASPKPVIPRPGNLKVTGSGTNTVSIS